MINTQFELYKLKRELKRSGITVEFQRPGKNEYGEPDMSLGPNLVGELKCLYHEQSSNIILTGTDASVIRTEKIPMLLCEYEEAKKLDLKVGDLVGINGKKLRYTGMVNIQEWDLIADISLEVIDDGTED